MSAHIDYAEDFGTTTRIGVIAADEDEAVREAEAHMENEDTAPAYSHVDRIAGDLFEVVFAR